MRHDYKARRLMFSQALNTPENGLKSAIGKMYLDECLSAQQIAQRLQDITGKAVTARTIQRLLKSLGISRTVGDAYRLAASQGRIKWAYKDPLLKSKGGRLSNAIRYSILQRDGFKCVLCGIDATRALLEIDHKTPKERGGKDERENLRTLCHDCNEGKRITEREK